jgi:ribosomal protein S18 acetylase RimI-like enzyme
MNIRPCALNDLKSITDLAQRYNSFDTKPTFADIEGMYSRNPEYFYVAEGDHGRILGFITGYERKELPEEVLRAWNAKRVGYVELMAVDMPHRGRGIGKNLMNTLLFEFRKNGVDIVNLDVPGGQEAALGLYKSVGFYIRAYNMRKRLTQPSKQND